MFIPLPSTSFGDVLRGPAVRKKSGVLREVIAVGRKTSFDGRTRIMTLQGDDTRYQVGYSTYRQSPTYRGDCVEFTVCRTGSTPDSRDLWAGQGVAVVNLTVTKRPWWRLR